MPGGYWAGAESVSRVNSAAGEDVYGSGMRAWLHPNPSSHWFLPWRAGLPKGNVNGLDTF